MKLYKYKQVAFKDDIPEKTSDLTNDSGYINQVKTINGNSIVGTGDITISGGIGMVVSTQASDTPYGVSWKKPDASDIGYQVITGTLVASVDTKGKFYLVSDIDAASPNVYNEYITVERLNEGSGEYQYFWEHVGTTQVDLTNYYTKLETNGLLEKVDGVKNQRDTTTGYKLWVGTQLQYNAIVSKDSATIYYITE